MRWLIKLLGGYTANEYDKEVKRLNEWNQVLQIQIDAFVKNEQLISKDPIHRAVFKLKSAIEKKEYSTLSEVIFSIADELKPLLDARDEHKETQELIDEILKIKVSLQASKTQVKDNSTNELEVIISNSLSALKNDPAYNKLSLSVHTLNMGTRAHNALDRAGYDIIGELVVAGLDDLAKINSMGKVSLAEIVKAMDEIEVAFEMQLSTEIHNAILAYTAAKINGTYLRNDVNLMDEIPANKSIAPSTVLMERDEDIVKPTSANEQNRSADSTLKTKSKRVPSSVTKKEFDIKEISIETRMTHIKKLANAIESYRASVGKNWKTSLRVNWSFDDFNPIHSEYVKYLKAINETGGARFIVSIASTTTVSQIESKSKNAFLGNSEFFKKLLSLEEV